MKQRFRKLMKVDIPTIAQSGHIIRIKNKHVEVLLELKPNTALQSVLSEPMWLRKEHVVVCENTPIEMLLTHPSEVIRNLAQSILHKRLHKKQNND